jgi:flagellar hook protein FlgE
VLDTITVGTSGLIGYSKGLRVIGNNLTNVNTPGFKQSELQFADLFYQSTGSDGHASGGTHMQLGTGLNTLATLTNFKQGDLRQTGNPLDTAVNGDGYFIMRAGDRSRYTRAGHFEFDRDRVLTNKTSGARVAGVDDSGKLVDITLQGLQNNAPKATTAVQLTGNLFATANADITLDPVKVFDPVGGEHVFKLTFKNNSATTPGSWTVTVADGGATVVGSGNIAFANGTIVAGSEMVALSYAPPNVAPFPIALDFSGATSNANATSIAMGSQDGFGAGALTSTSFDEDGTLVVSYSNGQTAQGAHLALARFAAGQDLLPVGGNEFESANGAPDRIGRAKTGAFGSISAGAIEGSNVDMAEEFSNLIVMQRGYQASSHVVSTANEMIQQLFDMKGRR